MILIALGANLPSPAYGKPLNTLQQALVRLERYDVQLHKASSWYETAPVPISDQPWFVNAVVSVHTALSPKQLMDRLHNIEADLGRQRRERWEARTIDMDLLSYNDLVLPDREGWGVTDGLDDLTLPHPRLHLRRFVLMPLVEIDPTWCHPVIRRTAKEMLDDLAAQVKPEEIVRPLVL